MKVIKPSQLSLLTRSFEVDRKYQLGVAILAFFDIETAELISEVELWKFAAEKLGKNAAVDAGLPKSNAEFLVAGSVFTPGGRPLETCPLTVRVGCLEKQLYVIGDRFWKGSQQSKPSPFTSLPIVWERAFGGEGYAKNPVGKGFRPVETDHGPVQFLPNIELPRKLITSPSQQPEPAGLGPIDITWPQRMSKAGTYDQKWLKELFPGFARDVDWTIHNVAPDDQQQREPFRGDEEIEIFNMHPRQERVFGRLPRLRARAFVTLAGTPDEQVVEVPMRLTTAWLFPADVKGILVFHGSLQTAEDDAADVAILMIGAEGLDEDRAVGHYRTVLANRLDKDKGVFYMLRDRDLLPSAVKLGRTRADEETEAIFKPEGLYKQNVRRKVEKELQEARALVASHGLDPDEHAPPAVPPQLEVPEDPVELFDFASKLEAEERERQARSQKEQEDRLKELDPVLRAGGIDPDAFREGLSRGEVGPPRFTAEGELARIRALRDDFSSLGVVVEELEAWLTDPDLLERWRQVERNLRDTYLTSAQFQGSAPRLPAEASARVRDEVVAGVRQRRSFAHVDLTGADLSGLDLTGADFRQGWLESTNLTGANLTGADFSQAVLAGADLSAAVLKSTRFCGANLGRARLPGVQCEGDVDLTEAVLMMADLSDARLRRVTLDKVLFHETRFARTAFEEVVAREVNFIKTDLAGLSFAGSTLGKVNFIEANVSGADFSDTTLDTVVFVQCEGRRIKLLRSKTKQLVVVLCGSFDEADFRGAALESANLRGASLLKADFSGACLDSADLSEAALRGATFYRATARKALLIKADLRDADLTSIDLSGANVQKADLRGTKLTGANLFGANFGRVHSDEATVLTDAFQKKVTIHPLRRR